MIASSVPALCNDPNWLEYPNLSYPGATRNSSGDADADTCRTVCTQNLGCNGAIYNSDSNECYISFDPSAQGITDTSASFYNVGRVCATSSTSKLSAT